MAAIIQARVASRCTAGTVESDSQGQKKEEEISHLLEWSV